MSLQALSYTVILERVYVILLWTVCLRKRVSCFLFFFLFASFSLGGIQVRGTLHISGMVVTWSVARSSHIWFLLCSRVSKLRIRMPFDVV